MIMDIEPINSATLPPYRRAKITFQDAEHIAKEVSELHLTESEAALRIGIQPVQWFRWKEKKGNNPKYGIMLTRMKANAIAQCTSRISKSAEGIDCKQPDWRAAAWRVERLAPERFANQAQSTAPQVTVQIGIIHEQLKRVIGFDNNLIEQPKIKMPIRKKPA